MSTFDVIILILSIASFIIGMRKGLVRELTGLLGYIIGVYGAVKFSGYTETIIYNHFGSDLFGNNAQGVGVVSFCITLAIIVVGVHFLSSVIDKAIGMTLLSTPNKILGGVFSVAKNLFIASCIISVANYFVGDVLTLLGEEGSSKSVAYPFVKEFAQMIYPYLDFGIDQVRQAVIR